MRRFLVIALVLGVPVLLVLALVIAAISNRSASIGAQPVTLTYWGVVDTKEQLEPVLSAFTSTRQNVTINYVAKDFSTYREELLDALASGNAPDLFQIPASWLEEYVTKGRVVELPRAYTVPEFVTKRQLFKKVTTIVPKSVTSVTVAELLRSYVPSVAEDSVVGGKIYGLPFAADTLAVFGNRDLLNVAQLPETPKTWDSLRLVTPKLRSVDAQGTVSRAAVALGTAETVPHAVDILTGLMAQGGATLLDPAAKQATFQRSIEKEYNPGLAATELYTSFAQKGKETYTWNDEQGDAFTAFTDGRVALYLGYQFELERIKKDAPSLADHIDVTPMLHLKDDGTDRYACNTASGCQPYNIANNWVTAVSTQSKSPNDAWDLIQFVARNAQVELLYAQSAHRTPVLKAALASAKTGGPEDIWISQAFTAHTWYHGNDAVAAEKALANMVTAVVKGTATATEALELAARQVTETLR